MTVKILEIRQALQIEEFPAMLRNIVIQPL